jgi:hypothetical protein
MISTKQITELETLRRFLCRTKHRWKNHVMKMKQSFKEEELVQIRGKGKGRPRIDHEGAEGGTGIALLFL